MSTLVPGVGDSAERAAIEWEVRLREGDASESELTEFRAWQMQSENGRAWMSLQERLARLRAAASTDPLATAAALRVSSEKRRKLLRASFGVGAFALTGVAVRQGMHHLGLDADWRSGIGKRETAYLADGSPMTIDAGSRVYRADTHRTLGLRVSAGQVMVRAGFDTQRMLKVSTVDGEVTSLGGDVNVGRIYRSSVVAINHGEALLSVPRHKPVRLVSGDCVAFSSAGPRRLAQPFELVSAWTRGLFVADNISLAELVDVFNRYSIGLLRATGGAADRKVSGVFILGDIERAVQQIADSLPVQLTRVGPYLTVFS